MNTQWSPSTGAPKLGLECKESHGQPLPILENYVDRNIRTLNVRSMYERGKIK